MATLVKDSGRKTPARLAGSAVLAMQPDERLVELARDGHERAFDAIVSRYRPALVRYCGRILPESRTEDAVQQAFINAHAALLAGEEPVQLKPWLYTVTRNSALNMLRQNGWNYEQIPADFDGVRRPDQVVEQRIQLQTTVAAVNDLPDRQRDALVMREFEGRSYEEIALALGTGDGAVRQLLNRARGTLRAVASALMPPPVVARAASSMPTTDGRRLAEVLAGIGAGGAVKVGATALVAGSLVVGAVKAPLLLVGGHSGSHGDKATLAPASKASDGAAAPTSNALPGDDHASPGSSHGSAPGVQGRDRGEGRKNAASHGKSGRHRPEHAVLAPGSRGENHRSPEHSGSGGGDHSGTRTGGDDHSGTSGGSGETRTGDDHSGTSGSGTTGSGDSGTSGSGESTTTGTDGGSGTSGSGDSTTTTGTDGGGSGTSGSGDSGTSTTTTGTDGSGSGTSGSGESGSTTTTTSTTSTSSGSDGSGSGTSTSTTTSGSGEHH